MSITSSIKLIVDFVVVHMCFSLGYIKAAATGVATAVGAPAAVQAVIGAVGYTASGITAGSIGKTCNTCNTMQYLYYNNYYYDNMCNAQPFQGVPAQGRSTVGKHDMLVVH